jgi:PAS domain S-box-containing protein/excisionase family DNA binding protein
MERTRDDGYLETAQVCNQLGIHRSTLWRLVREGRLRQYSVPWSKHPRYRADEVRALKQAPGLDDSGGVAAWAESALEAVWLLDVRARVRYANATAARVVGRSAMSQVGEMVAALFAPESLAPALAAIERAVSGNAVRLATLALRGAEGETLRRDATFTPLRQDGLPTEVLLIARDLTPEREAAEATARTRIALQASPVGIVISDPGAVIVAANPVAGTLVAEAPEALVGRRIESLFSSANPIGTADAVHRGALAGGWQGEVWLRAPAGESERWVRMTAAAAWDDDRVVGLLLLIAPWEEERQREQERLAAAQLQGAVRALQALEGPLTERLHTLEGNLRLLKMSLGSAEGRVAEGLHGANSACDALLALARGLWSEAAIAAPSDRKGLAPGRERVV